MKRNFNKQAATMTFCAGVIVYIVIVGITMFVAQEQVPLIGALVYGILTLAASIISGLIVPINSRFPKYDYLEEPIDIKKYEKDNTKKKKRGRPFKKRGRGRPKKK